MRRWDLGDFVIYGGWCIAFVLAILLLAAAVWIFG